VPVLYPLESPGLESDSSPYVLDLDFLPHLDSDPEDLDLDSDFAHKTKVKAIHEFLVND